MISNLGMWALNLLVVTILGFIAWSAKKMLSNIETKLDQNSTSIGDLSTKVENENKARMKEIISLSDKIELENKNLSDKLDVELKGISEKFEDKLEALRQDIDALGDKTDERIKELEKEFADYKERAAYKFVNKEEFVRAISGMDNKLDKIYEKLTIDRKEAS